MQTRMLEKQKTIQRQKTKVEEMLDASPYAQDLNKTKGAARSSNLDKIKVSHGITRKDTRPLDGIVGISRREQVQSSSGVTKR